MKYDNNFLFANALLNWFDQHGRKHLPWQDPITPYRVWLSEIMLQQTQVDTVIPYFTRFLERFETVEALAKTPQEDVLHLWTGLGYYARARNLHKCAQQIVELHDGDFPQDAEQLTTLPGIGKSTARAICSIAFGHAEAILDGNVKRVLARFHAVEGWPGKPAIEKILWQHAESHMPDTRCGDYTQAIMDLGATLCTRSKPRCNECPMRDHCQAHALNKTAELPTKKPSKVSPIKAATLLILKDSQQRIQLEQRPQSGIWGGLWSFPEFDNCETALATAQQTGAIQSHEVWSQFRHVFSHYKLDIQPCIVELDNYTQASKQNNKRWVTLEQALKLGLPAPVKSLIEKLAAIEEQLI
ncbi:MAG: A/G-specific adenine glycosylase [Agarilytica sp.]